MPIANFTTSVPVSRTVSEIQSMLATSGAEAVMLEYGENQSISRISFRINRNGNALHFKLPSRWAGVLSSMEGDPKVPQRLCTAEHAQRVAWRIVRDWLRAQLALIEAGCAVLEEIMLPYLHRPDGKTLYQQIADSGFKALPEPNKKS